MSLKDDYSLEQESNPETLEFGNAEFIQIRYTDVPGRFLAKYLFSDGGDSCDCFRSGIGVDGSSVKGFTSINESDLLLVPDRSTIRLAPIQKYKVAAVIADVYEGFHGRRLAKDPRYVSQSMEECLTHEGLSCQLGPEVECFIFDDIAFNNGADKINDKPEIISAEQFGKSKYPIRRKGGYDAPPFQDSLLEFRFEVAEILKNHYSIKVTNLNHEVASNGQIEINFIHSTLTKAADNVQIYKDVVRNVAKQYGKVANFMPKPIIDENNPKNSDNGSGMHASVSLWTKSSSGAGNIFYDINDSYAELSQAGRYFIGGLLDHARSLSALVAPTINSYYRIVPGFEAPVYIAWSRGNRSAVIRVPVNERRTAGSKRVEFRVPDPSANPYLAFSAVVAAGLDGIKKKIDPGNPVNEDIYKMSDHDRKSLGIKSLPGSLQESLEALQSDSGYLKLCFSDELLETHIALKQTEIAEGKSMKQQFLMYYDV